MFGVHLVLRIRLLLLAEVGNISLGGSVLCNRTRFRHWWVQFSHRIDSIPFLWYQKRFPELGPRFGQRLHVCNRLLWLPGVAIWAIFEVLGGLVI